MLPSTLTVLSLSLLAGVAVSAMRVPDDDFGRVRRALISQQFNPANINAACHSLCNVPIETINACTTLSCACTGPTVGALVKCVDCSVSLSPTAAHQEEGQVYLNNIHAICLAGGYNVGPLKVTVSSVAESSTSAASSSTSVASSSTSAASSSTSAASSSTPAAPSSTASSAPSPDSTSTAFPTLTAPAGGSSPNPSSVGSTTPSPPASSPAPSSGTNPGTFGGAAGQTSADASVRDFSVLVLAGSVVLSAVAVF